METHEEVGKFVGLQGVLLDVFVKYMKERWPSKELEHVRHGYSKEWAIRFRSGIAYSCSDSVGQALLDSWGYKE